MSTEKYDKGLRQKLEAMNEVPVSYTFNPAAKWQQLESKMQPKPAKKKIGWLYWAAASLLIICPMLLWHQGSKQQETASVQNKISKDNQEAVVVRAKSTLQKQAAKQSSNHIISIKSIATATNRNRTQSSAGENILKGEPINVSAEDNKALIITTTQKPVTTIAETQLPANKSQPTVSTVVKIKRKVVHFNELGEEQLQPVIIARNDKKAILQEENNTSSTESSKARWLFKSKPVTTSTSLTDDQ